MSEDKNCFFCESECEINTAQNMHTVKEYGCTYCGSYLLDRFFIGTFKPSNTDKFKMACVLNERRLKGLGGVALSNKADKEKRVCGYPVISFDELLNEFPKKASDFLNRTLLNLSRLRERPFEVIKLDMTAKKDWLYFFTPEKEGCRAFLLELAGQKYIRFNEVPGGYQYDVFFLTTKFWEIVDNFKKTEADNKNAFVAMWFDRSMDDVFEKGLKAIENDIGFEMFRVDQIQFNDEKICDKIISKIRESRFLVADVTGQRQAVYFEAGYAMGMGLSVIWTCKESDSKNCCFDTRQYPHIFWEDIEDLKVRLRDRILATIGRGRYSTP